MRVLLVDNNNGFRRLLRRILEAEPGGPLVLEAKDGDEGVRLAPQFQPDVVLVGIDAAGTASLEAARRIKEQVAGASVVILWAFDSADGRKRAAESGADAFLLKSAPISEILSTIRELRPTQAA